MQAQTATSATTGDNTTERTDTGAPAAKRSIPEADGAPSGHPGRDHQGPGQRYVAHPDPDSRDLAGQGNEGELNDQDEAALSDPARAEAVIAHGRGRIDALDAQIIALVQQRREASDRVQRARLASGGRRLELSREMEVLQHYNDALCRPGTQLAMTLLGLCRGQL